MRVMFVDDEPNVLSGIRRMLRSMRSQWDMCFVESGASALEQINGGDCDVVVCDMRMPGMDGAELLSKVRGRHPGTIRIALSGETEQSMIYRCVQHAHQYLSKPCDAETLIETVRRATQLQELLSDKTLAAKVSEMSTIPSLPEQYKQIMDELQSDDASLRRIGEIVESDVAMTAKILQLVNSAFFGMTTHISSPSQATMLLGVDVIRALVVISGVFSQFAADLDSYVDLNTIWSRSTKVGALAKKIAVHATKDKFIADYALMGGMLIDIGQLVISASAGPEKAAALKAGVATGASEWDVELEILGQNHMKIGAYLVGLWGLPNAIIESVAYHHEPSTCGSRKFTALTAVHAALAIVSESDSSGSTTLDTDYIENLGLTENLDDWRQLYNDLTERA